MLHLALAPISLSLLVGPLPQEAPAAGADVAQGFAAEAAAALRALAQRDLVFEGEARLEQPERDDEDSPFGADGMFVQILDGSPFGGPPYTGGLEVVLRKEGDRLVCSERSAPGFVAYADGTTTLKRLTFADAPPPVDPVLNELVQLLDVERLAAEVAAAEVTRTAAGTRTVYGGPLRGAYVLPPKAAADGPFGNPFGGMSASIMELRFELVLDADRACERLEFSVTRSDPQAAMLRQFQAFEVDGEEQGVVEIAVDGGPADLEEIEGATSVYTFHALDMAPTERAQKALAELRAVALELRREGR